MPKNIANFERVTPFLDNTSGVYGPEPPKTTGFNSCKYICYYRKSYSHLFLINTIIENVLTYFPSNKKQ